MKSNKIIKIDNINQLIDKLDGPIETWSFNKGSVENRYQENTNAVYVIKTKKGSLTAYSIDSSYGANVRWEIKA